MDTASIIIEADSEAWQASPVFSPIPIMATWPLLFSVCLLFPPFNIPSPTNITARRPDSLNTVIQSLKNQNSNAVLEAFPTDTSPANLRKAFADIKAHQSFKGLKLKVAVFSIKNSAKKPFMEETVEDFMAPMETYVGGAMVFAQETLKRLFEDHGEKTLAEGSGKKGTLVCCCVLVKWTRCADPWGGSDLYWDSVSAARVERVCGMTSDS